MHERAAVRVDSLEALRGDETAHARLEELVALAEHLQLARLAPPVPSHRAAAVTVPRGVRRAM
eukprot:834230-Prymnesium_polylepis.1